MFEFEFEFGCYIGQQRSFSWAPRPPQPQFPTRHLKPPSVSPMQTIHHQHMQGASSQANYCSLNQRMLDRKCMHEAGAHPLALWLENSSLVAWPTAPTAEATCKKKATSDCTSPAPSPARVSCNTTLKGSDETEQTSCNQSERKALTAAPAHNVPHPKLDSCRPAKCCHMYQLHQLPNRPQSPSITAGMGITP